MHKQLILLHNAIAAYFSGNAMALESTLKQFNIKVSTKVGPIEKASSESLYCLQLKSPNNVSGSWLEQ